MLLLRQVWALAHKDLLIFRRRWISTSIRALILPVIFIFVLCYIKYWTATPGVWGVGTPAPILSLTDALAAATATRSRVVIIDNGLNSGDIGHVISGLTTTINGSGKELHILPNASQLMALCPSSNAGISPCYGAVEFHQSPGHGNSSWNYTLYGDQGLSGALDVTRQTNDAQIYELPFQHAINALIGETLPGAPQLPDNMLQYPFTFQSEAAKEQRNLEQYMETVQFALSFAFTLGFAGLVYHCIGHIAHQREQGMLPLIDAMMPNRRKWTCIAIRVLSCHIAFDLTYLPGWLGMGGLMKLAFPNTNVGCFIALYLLGGLATTSYSILVSSLFRKAQISSICGVIAAVVFAVVAVYGETLSVYSTVSGALATGLLFPPSTFVYFIVEATFFEIQGMPLNLTVLPPVETGVMNEYAWIQTPGTFLGLFVFQIVLYPILGAIIEHYLHGTDCAARKVLDGAAMGNTAVRIQDFHKEYKSRVNKKEKITAVDNLSTELHRGSITVLLGANGSGKSTTLTSIAGLQKITKGVIEIDGTGGLGICPQQNVLWDDVTVEEHVRLFDLLKATFTRSHADREQEVTRLIDGCDLTIKRHAKAKTLSGGQKRKLQLAMMLAGGSQVCCIDEATSGIDPLARRKIWDILLRERGYRTLLLTTHFLDEAEVLSDHVVILSKGQLKAQGSVAALKAELGGGFKVLLGTNSKDIAIPSIPQVQRSSDYNRAVFEVPDSKVLAKLISTLERSNLPGSHEYTIHGPTVEEIFLSLSDEMQGDSDLARELSANNADEQQSPDRAEQQREFVLETGKGVTAARQTLIMFRKRLTILKHNYMPYVAALFVPLVLAGLVTRFFIGYIYPNGVPCFDASKALPFAGDVYIQPSDLFYGHFVYGPPDRVDLAQLQSIIPTPTGHAYYDTPPPQSSWDAVPTATSMPDFDNYVSSNAEDLYLGGFFDDPAGPVLAWSANDGQSVWTVYLQTTAESLLLNHTIAVSSQTFGRAFVPPSDITAIVAVFTVLGFAIYPGFFALYPTAERLRHVRAMQYSNGIKSSSLWVAYALFDLMFILLISILTVVIWSTQWAGWYALPYMFVVFFLYGLAATAFSYTVSLFVSSQLAAFAFTAVIQVIIAMLYFTGYVISAANAPADQIYTWFNYIHYTVSLVCPATSLFRALMMVVNNYSLVCNGLDKATYPGLISIYGAPILYLTIQFFLLVGFLMFWESDRSLEVFGIHRRRTLEHPDQDEEKADRQSSTTSEACEDADHMSKTNDGLRVSNLSKSFGSVQAVDDVTFGILPSEKFALLGPNGAGKSTTISLIRGDLKPDRRTHGSIYIGNDSLHDTPVAAKSHLGVCPQFDATDSMTLREHLVFYARARGVPNAESNINELIRRLGLEPHSKKMVKKLSGGTHRKLSLAIALIANPRCLLLDEPSSGMDPAAKRALWRTLRQTAAGRVLLLTTHSMEEAAALCDRAGILAGQLLALGSIEQLRRRHGPAACVYLVHRAAPHSSAAEMLQIRAWVTSNFPAAELEDRAFGGQVRFTIPRAQGDASDSLMGELFRRIEAARDDLGIVDYSIGPATLDQVFLDVINAHGVQEENMEEERHLKWLRFRK